MAGNGQIAIEFCQGHQHKRTLGHARVRQFDLTESAGEAVDGNDIEIERTRRPLLALLATEFDWAARLQARLGTFVRRMWRRAPEVGAERAAAI